MATNEDRHKLVYKYRAFSHHSLDMLVEDRLYFADPSTFNDALDTKPRLDPDIDNQALERVLAIDGDDVALLAQGCRLAEPLKQVALWNWVSLAVSPVPSSIWVLPSLSLIAD
ncbi:hypothetical protein [Polymorphobacter megasporae]|uniref:hypothetical protein n=1 Tax=Glacieibacterium megasporae TaxID=2835787 RepID=UPI001C1E66DD|nr:hypothetical protein [Polymorphobacter megasporae]UAJ08877.1 hypothetical protein KTC28_10855 [Polymorphobacter megasporae]